MAYPPLSLTGAVVIQASTTSQAQAIPSAGTPTVVIATNLGSNPAFVALGSSSSVVASPATGAVVPPGAQLPVAIGANTFIAAVTLVGGSGVHLAFGT